MKANCGKVSTMFPDHFVNYVPDRSGLVPGFETNSSPPTVGLANGNPNRTRNWDEAAEYREFDVASTARTGFFFQIPRAKAVFLLARNGFLVHSANRQACKRAIDRS